jgi:hypothetical protein
MRHATAVAAAGRGLAVHRCPPRVQRVLHRWLGLRPEAKDFPICRNGAIAAFGRKHGWSGGGSCGHCLISRGGYETAPLVYPVFAVVVLASTCLADDVGMNRFLTLRPLLWLGQISYSIYMLHQAIFWGARPFLRVVVQAPMAATEDGAHVYLVPLWLSMLPACGRGRHGAAVLRPGRIATSRTGIGPGPGRSPIVTETVSRARDCPAALPPEGAAGVSRWTAPRYTFGGPAGLSGWSLQ